MSSIWFLLVNGSIFSRFVTSKVLSPLFLTFQPMIWQGPELLTLMLLRWVLHLGIFALSLGFIKLTLILCHENGATNHEWCRSWCLESPGLCWQIPTKLLSLRWKLWSWQITSGYKIMWKKSSCSKTSTSRYAHKRNYRPPIYERTDLANLLYFLALPNKKQWPWHSPGFLSVFRIIKDHLHNAKYWFGVQNISKPLTNKWCSTAYSYSVEEMTSFFSYSG